MRKKYKFSASDYLLERSSAQSSTAYKDKETFFCSSLVACLYKCMGLIDPVVSSTQYLPSSFGEKNKLEILSTGKFGKAKLGP